MPDSLTVPPAVRAQGAAGQNVNNKVSSAIHLRFDIRASSLPEHIKARLLVLDARHARWRRRHQGTGTSHAGHESRGGWRDSTNSSVASA